MNTFVAVFVGAGLGGALRHGVNVASTFEWKDGDALKVDLEQFH